MSESPQQQIQLRYAPLEDRLLLRINSPDREELKFWFTRRMVKRLWGGFVSLLDQRAAQSGAVDPVSRRAMMAFSHESANAAGDFATPYQERDAAPAPEADAANASSDAAPEARQREAGEVIPLVATCALQNMEDGSVRMTLNPEEGEGISLTMTVSLFHNVCKLFGDSVAKADWDMQLRFPGLEPSAPSGGAKPRSAQGGDGNLH
ncbi:hypothetical protein [Magnetofaba australis]|uniref:Uncharacterized protein n=1 Tax=Magnetofaba australis IT-1 TaxID=1434232 RepID=A0A1Y2K0K0_9PROT|nr:hypothetical protein [Magnetofaba australis]OSM01551.1 hypothetical protein MAIT1_01547 [Magnetofaba australis IT-1]